MDKKKEKFFYAEVEAGMYDATIALTTPYYTLAVNSMLDLICYHLKTRKIQKDKISVLDIGSGTGNESIKILKTCPNCEVLAVDFCEPMKVEFENNFNNTIGIESRVRYNYWIVDFLNSGIDQYLEFLNKRDKQGFDIIITAYTLHHYDESEKFKFYEKIYKLLIEGGLFINIDLYDYQSSDLSFYSNEHIISYIKAQFSKPDAIFQEALKVPLVKRLELSKKWVNHYQKDNILTPIEKQQLMLIKIGFSQTGIPFMYFQNGLLWATK